MRFDLRKWLPDPIRNGTRQLRFRATEMQVRFRALGRRERLRPAFLIIGAMKAGTTSLFRYLCEHPDVVAPIRKEIHYFNFNWSQPAGWYQAHFPVAAKLGSGVVSGEASPGYLVHPRAPHRARECLHDARIIVLLRDPVTRALSHYFHERRIGRETRPMDIALFASEARTRFTLSADDEHEWYEAFNAGPRRGAAATALLASCPMNLSYITHSLYADYLPAWFDAFGRDRVLVLRSEDLFSDSSTQLARTLEFLGLSAAPPAARAAHNVGSYPEPIPAEIQARLAGEFADANRRLRDLLGSVWHWDQAN